MPGPDACITEPLNNNRLSSQRRGENKAKQKQKIVCLANSVSRPAYRHKVMDGLRAAVMQMLKDLESSLLS